MWVAVLLFVMILGLLVFLDTKKPKNYPPGPKWLPIFGSGLEIARLRKETGYLSRALAQMARQYGPIMGTRVGKDRIVVLCGYEIIREMLSNEKFDGRPHGPFYETRTWGMRRGVLLVDQEFWQEQRRFTLRHLREFGYGRRHMVTIVEDEAAHLLRRFKSYLEESPQGATVSMNDAFGVHVLNTLWLMMASIRYSEEDKEFKDLQSMLTELFKNIDMVGCLFSQFPILRYIAPTYSGYNEFISIHKRIWTFLKTELDEHKKTISPNDVRDFMDVYLNMLVSKDPKPNSFSETQLMAICMDMFMAGSETTSKSLGFGFLYLLLFPDVQKKCQAEIDRVVGRDRLPKIEDRPNMPFMEATVLESIRMFMGRGFGVPHRALEDAELAGYSIPKDTMILYNTHAILMDPNNFPDPYEFRPERYIDHTGKAVIPDPFLPFGFGKHRCMGESLAKSNIFLFTTTLLQTFDFSVIPGCPPPSTEEIDGVTPAPAPFSAYVTYRVTA